MANAPPPPIQDKIVRPQGGGAAGTVTDPWIEYFNEITKTLDVQPRVLATVALTAQDASITATDMTDGTLSAGVYRVQYYARITRAATTSSSLTVSLSWTDGGVSPTFTGVAITGNTTLSFESRTQFIRIQANSPITFATTYASVGATSMQYSLYIKLEEIP